MARAAKKEKDADKNAKKSSGKVSLKGKRTSVSERVASSRLLMLPESIAKPRLFFILVVVILSVFGLVMVYSSSSITAYNDFHNASYYFDRQARFLVLGVIACVVVAAIPYKVWNSLPAMVVIWTFCVATLAMTALGMGVAELGAERSISLGGFLFQPSEFAKIGILIVACNLLVPCAEESFKDLKANGILMLAVIIPIVLIYKQPDLGTVLILVFGVAAMAVLGGLGIRWIVGLFVVAAAYVALSCITQPYHLTRILMMLDPFSDPDGSGYQSVQSFYAFSSGGLLGQGLGLSRQKYLYLPYAHTDFVFSVIGEELGFAGAAATVLLFAALGIFGFRIAHMAPDRFGSLLACGLTSMLCFQAVVNMASASGLGPVTGKALPFISYGGSSLLATFVIVGLILSVSFHSRLGAKYEKRRDNLRVIDGRGAVGQPSTRTAARDAGVAGFAGSAKGFVGKVASNIGKRTKTDRAPAAKMRSNTRRASAAGARGTSQRDTQRSQGSSQRRAAGSSQAGSREWLSSQARSKRNYSSPAERAKARNGQRSEERRARFDDTLSHRGQSRNSQPGRSGRESSSNRSSNRSSRRR